ncbi:MAG: hypothetical protein HC788_02145 [Sphingopyxis sp.]|nr:hypothetical protein [Sphingopyxis sp.]
MDRNRFTIELTDEESAIASALNFNQVAFASNYDGYLINADLAHRLTTSLLNRGAIPQHRARYFADPELYPGGRGASRQDNFVRHGNSHDEILRHPNFLKYLRYFVYGAELPAAVIAAFADAVEDCGMVTSGDIVPLGQKARQLARSHSLERTAAAEEFYKLCLDLGLSPNQSASIRTSVLQLRNRR